jgi:Ca2+-binding EF-hand superfamily protein
MEGNPGYITGKELITFFGNVGLKISQEDAYSIMADHNSEQTDYLNVEDFFSKLTCWKDKKSMAVAPAV